MGEFEEIFTLFGYAYYLSECLHRTLCIFHAMKTSSSFHRVTRPRLEENLAQAFNRTLGQIIEKTKNLLSKDIQDKLEIALEKRNYLAHQFWYERCHIMFSEQGLIELIKELYEISKLFNDLDETIMKELESSFQDIGLTEKAIEESTVKIILGESDSNKYFKPRRFLKKRENIVRAYDVKADKELITQIFETEDGHL